MLYLQTTRIAIATKDINSVLGFVLSGADWDAGNLTLTSVGAFAAYSWTAGDRVWLINNNTSYPLGSFVILSKDSNDQITLESSCFGSDLIGGIDSLDGITPLFQVTGKIALRAAIVTPLVIGDALEMDLKAFISHDGYDLFLVADNLGFATTDPADLKIGWCLGSGNCGGGSGWVVSPEPMLGDNISYNSPHLIAPYPPLLGIFHSSQIIALVNNDLTYLPPRQVGIDFYYELFDSLSSLTAIP